ncbi:MAG: PorP/SprF family type IX secretion system membrane protein [Bacteroidales bacterium]|nr:PorP/SprF family type IX secretion system membrane protein [Bacteroidales bacterium]
MKKLALVALILYLAISLWSQNVLTQKFYLHNFSLINPSCVNLYATTKIGIFSHHQWFSVKNYPYTQGIVVTGSQQETGWGVSLLNNRWGTMANLSVNLNYAYKAKLNDEWNVSTGISANVNQFSLNQTTYQPSDANDPALSFTKEKAILPNFNAGVVIHQSKAHIGISLINILQSKYKLTINEDELNKMVRYYAIHGAYLFNFDEKFSLQPSFVAMKNIYQKIFLDATATCIYDGKYSASIGFNSVKEMSLMAGLTYQQFHFSYAYGFNMFLSSYVKSSFHEISVMYRFSKDESKKLL